MIAAVATVVRVALARVAVVAVVVSGGDDSRSQPDGGIGRSVGGIVGSGDDATSDVSLNWSCWVRHVNSGNDDGSTEDRVVTSKVQEEIVLVNCDIVGLEGRGDSAADSTSLGVGVWVSDTVFNLGKRVELIVTFGDDAVIRGIISLDISVGQNSEFDDLISCRSSNLDKGSASLDSLVRKLREKDISGKISINSACHAVANDDWALSEKTLVGDASGNSVLDKRGRVLLVGSPPGAVIRDCVGVGSGGSGSVRGMAGGGMAVGADGSGMAVGAVG